VKTAVYVAAVGLSTLALLLGDAELALLTAAAAYGVAAWRNHGSVAVAAGLHVFAAAASPAALFSFLQAAPAAVAALPLKESPLAIPVALAATLAAVAAESLLASVRDVAAVAQHWQYVAAAFAVALLAYLAARV